MVDDAGGSKRYIWLAIIITKSAHNTVATFDSRDPEFSGSPTALVPARKRKAIAAFQLK